MTKTLARTPAEGAGDRQLGEIVALSLGLGLLLLAVKIALLPFPVGTFSEFVRWTLRLAIVAAPDLCFVAALATTTMVAARVAQKAPRLHRLVRLGSYLGFYLAGVYGVASVAIYRWTMVPLKLEHLYLTGGTGSMLSSVAACVDVGFALWLAAVPLAFGAALWSVRRFVGGRVFSRLGVRSGLAILAMAAAYGFVCRTYIHARWDDPNRWERRIAQSPHAVLLGSCFEELVRSRDGRIAEAFRDADISDFTTRRREEPELPPGLKNKPLKNVLVVLLESAGVEYLQLYGADFETTPKLNRLAAEQGIVFDNAYVQTPCSCKSLVALTAGVYPRPDWGLIVRDCPEFNVPTLPAVLQQRGWRTCFAHSGYWRWKGRDRYLRDRGVGTLIDASTLAGQEVNSWGVSDRAMYQACLDWIDRSPEEPFCLLAYTIETHHPYVAREPLWDFGVEDEQLNRYLNALRQADANIGWLIQQLRRRGLDESTLVVVTSDHGESFGQHNQRIHSFGLYEPAVHVPLVLLNPAFADTPRRRVSGVRQHIDVPPTIAGLLGVPAPNDWQGAHLLRTEDANERVYFFATGNGVALGLREGRWKYHFYLDSGREELFDLRRDPGESDNLAESHRARCGDYKRRVGGLVNFQRQFLSRRGAE